MNSVLIWDLPIRLFHWLLSAGFLAAAFIALAMGEHSPLFPYHAIIGLTIALMVVLRIVWGFVGTSHARFGSFVYGPRAVIEYMTGTLAGGGSRHVGHNPGSAVAIFAMLALVLALAVTGFLMGRGIEWIEDIHKILAWTTVGVVVVHVLGVALHTIRHRENITASMIHGKKRAEPQDAIRSAKPVVAILFMAVTGGWLIGLVRNYNPATQTTTLPMIGTSLTLGEGEGEDEEEDEDEDEGSGRDHRGQHDDAEG